ncbi:hypothetical protein BDZ94DRAFT_1315282 [Collybia nuda]|uniref:Uncharacterized protein n=1 Tax=Collybia nuda TaxID=64659 RepID=A0A9P5XT02_9AGAR|nr:hypothetical protein BDZ94DRAFT_1315282 [Collybia nuda]
MKLPSFIIIIVLGLISFSISSPTPYSADNLTHSNNANVDVYARTPQKAGPIGIAFQFLQLVNNIVKTVQHLVETDNEVGTVPYPSIHPSYSPGASPQKRERFTTAVVGEGRLRFPEYNFVVCHANHTYKWDGVRGEDWDVIHKEVDIVLGGTIGYDIYFARSGTFQLLGDGG